MKAGWWVDDKIIGQISDSKHARVSLNSCGVGVNLVGDGKFLSEILSDELIGRTLSSPSVGPANGKNPTLIVHKSNRFILREGYPEAVYYGKNKDDVVSIAKHMLERRKQEQGLYTIHGSAVSKNDRAVFLFGWKNTGKTSVAISLTRLKGFSFVSDGQATIDKNIRLVGSVPVIEEIYPYIRQKYKVSKDLNELRHEDPSKKVKIGMFVFPQIACGNKVIEWGNSPKSIFHMYELLSIEIRGIYSSYINGFRRPLSSLDTLALSVKRLSLARKIASEVPIFQIRGNINFICNTIDRIFSKIQ